ncbi:hypothetical protein ACWIDW_07195 [Microbacterium sp. NPDC055312]
MRRSTACEQLRLLPVTRRELCVLDLVYVLGVIAVFVVVGLLGKAVERL